MRKGVGKVCVRIALFVILATSVSIAAAEPKTSRVRQPVALAWAEGGQAVLVANQRGGSLSVIDANERTVVAEFEIGRAVADIAAVAGGGQFVAVDPVANEVVLVDFVNSMVSVRDRIPVSADPVRLIVSSDGRSCVVASRWSRRLTFVDLATKSQPGTKALAIAGTVELPFSPRALAIAIGGSRLVAADAFGGRLAVVDLKTRAIESVRTLPAHNIRGLAFARDGRTLVVAHQYLNRLGQARFDDVHWGDVIRNHLRVLTADALWKPGTDRALLDGGRLFELGDVGYAAGDPAGLAFDIHGNLIVALAGVDEVAITARPEQGPKRIVVGRRPLAVLPSPDGSVVLVANSLDDTISVVEIATGQRLATISLGPRPELTAIDRGERLFHSAKLAHDGWMSCQSCHVDGHTSGLASDTLSDGSYGAPKRIASLLGVAATGPWTWRGSVTRLDDQVKKSIEITMQGTKPTSEQVADLTAYLKSLTPPTQDAKSNSPAPAIARGQEIFESRKCAACHAPPEFTSPERYDVGLSDEVGNHEFNPPSLRAVGLRDTLLHDGRAHSLDEVFVKVRHPRGLVLTADEIADLVAYLKTL